MVYVIMANCSFYQPLFKGNNLFTEAKVTKIIIWLVKVCVAMLSFR